MMHARVQVPPGILLLLRGHRSHKEELCCGIYCRGVMPIQQRSVCGAPKKAFLRRVQS
jgi:hypothetical protein